MQRLDAWFARLYERFAHAVQRRTGVTSYRLARTCAVWLALENAARALDYWYPDLMASSDPWGAAGVILCSFSFILDVMFARAAERRRAQFARNPTVVPARFWPEGGTFQLIRLFVVTLMPLLLLADVSAIAGGYRIGGAVSLLGTLGGAFTYFIDTVPLPPGQVRARARRRVIGFHWRPAGSEA